VHLVGRHGISCAPILVNVALVPSSRMTEDVRAAMTSIPLTRPDAAPNSVVAAVDSSVEMSFIVPVRNDADGIERCLNSIAAAGIASKRSVEAIVVDNESIDGSGTRAHALGATVIHLHGRVARLRNLAANAARGQVLAFVDADHEIVPGWVTAAMERLEDESIAAIGAAYHPPSPANWVQRTYDLLRDHQPGFRQVPWLGSGNLVVQRRCFEAVGGFDETLETCEDVDLCQRLRRAGFRVLADSRLRSTHYGDPSTLRRLFVSELWRGRDNLRVSMREPSLRDLPSVAIPILDLFAVATAAGAMTLWGFGGVPVASGAGLFFLAFSSLRAWRMATRAKIGTIRELAQAWTVALIYDAARALALVVRAPHRRAAGPLVSER
jgi:GT2 family glycosyltransferase